MQQETVNSRRPPRQRRAPTCLSLTRSGPNTRHWISFATSIRKQQAVFTSTWEETMRSATNTSALFRRRESRGGKEPHKTDHCSQNSASCLFFFWWNLSLASSKTRTVAEKSLHFFSRNTSTASLLHQYIQRTNLPLHDTFFYID